MFLFISAHHCADGWLKQAERVSKFYKHLLFLLYWVHVCNERAGTESIKRECDVKADHFWRLISFTRSFDVNESKLQDLLFIMAYDNVQRLQIQRFLYEKQNLHSSPVVCGHINMHVYAHKYMWVYGKDLCPQSKKSSRAAEFSSTCFFCFVFSKPRIWKSWVKMWMFTPKWVSCIAMSHYSSARWCLDWIFLSLNEMGYLTQLFSSVLQFMNVI